MHLEINNITQVLPWSFPKQRTELLPSFVQSDELRALNAVSYAVIRGIYMIVEETWVVTVVEQEILYFLLIRLKNSSLVFAALRIAPSIQLVVVVAPVF